MKCCLQRHAVCYGPLIKAACFVRSCPICQVSTLCLKVTLTYHPVSFSGWKFSFLQVNHFWHLQLTYKLIEVVLKSDYTHKSQANRSGNPFLCPQKLRWCMVELTFCHLYRYIRYRIYFYNRLSEFLARSNPTLYSVFSLSGWQCDLMRNYTLACSS